MIEVETCVLPRMRTFSTTRPRSDSVPANSGGTGGAAGGGGGASMGLIEFWLAAPGGAVAGAAGVAPAVAGREVRGVCARVRGVGSACAAASAAASVHAFHFRGL